MAKCKQDVIDLAHRMGVDVVIVRLEEGWYPNGSNAQVFMPTQGEVIEYIGQVVMAEILVEGDEFYFRSLWSEQWVGWFMYDQDTEKYRLARVERNPEPVG